MISIMSICFRLIFETLEILKSHMICKTMSEKWAASSDPSASQEIDSIDKIS